MAPEAVQGSKTGYTSKSDIWSVGCVVFDMWAGRGPWEDEQMIAVMRKVSLHGCVVGHPLSLR
jgi:serine/threonine protein kinase